MVIPKIIHYCWFGGKPLPEEAKKCIDSWKKYLPDYEIKEWNESNFDINSIAYTAEAYEARKYAFVSDYARYKILYEHGGIYFDTDVEVIAPMDDLLAKGPFMGQEDYLSAISLQNEKTISVRGINPGIGMAATPGMQFFGQYAAESPASEAADSDISVHHADFIKIRNVVLGYDFPVSLVRRLGVNHLALRFQVDNPGALWTRNNIGVDPETLGVRNRTSYVFGLNINL